MNARYSLTLFAVLLMFTVCTAQKVKAPIGKATVFLNGAEISRTAEVKLKAGKSTLVFSEISANIRSESIRVSVGQDVTILSVSDRRNYLHAQQRSKSITTLSDSLAKTRDEVALTDGQIATLRSEKELLFREEAIGGVSSGVPVEEIEKAANFFRRRSNEIHEELFRLEKANNRRKRSVQAMERQLAGWNAENVPPVAEILITVNTSRPIEGDITVQYLVDGAGWQPKYDIRAQAVGEPIHLSYKANVYNNTGVDWKNVKLALSTAEPTRNMQKPQLTTWKIDSYSDRNGGGNNDRDPATQPAGEGPSSALVKFSDIEVSELYAEFAIEQPYTIPADAKPYLVDVKEADLPVKYKYYAVPKVERDAFLVARVADWQQLDLVTGPASVYYGDSYIGRTTLRSNTLVDTLEIALGRDKKIQFSRTRKVDFQYKQLVGSQEKEKFVYELQLRNNRSTGIEIEILDQVPVSTDGKVTVTINDISNAIHDKDSGVLSWKVRMSPGEAASYTMAYTVKAPKGRTYRPTFRTISCPSF